MEPSEELIRFEILGEKFSIKSDVPKEYFLSLVQDLNERVKTLKEKFPTLTNLKLVIFAALDIVDELKQVRKKSLGQEDIQIISNLAESLATAMKED